MHSPQAEADRRLFERLDRSTPAGREMLAERYLPLARSLARSFAGTQDSYEDIFQVACFALVKAIDRYDPERGRAFTTYATPTIVGEIKRYFRDLSWTVRPPRDLQEVALKAARARDALTQETGRQPTIGELADRLGVDDETLLDALQALDARHGTPLDAPVDPESDAGTVGELIGGPDSGFADVEQRLALDGLMACLDERQRTALSLRFEHDLTQAEIGAELGLSQMQVSRILRSALDRLRHVAEHRAGQGAPADLLRAA